MIGTREGSTVTLIPPLAQKRPQQCKAPKELEIFERQDLTRSVNNNARLRAANFVSRYLTSSSARIGTYLTLGTMPKVPYLLDHADSF